MDEEREVQTESQPTKRSGRGQSSQRIKSLVNWAFFGAAVLYSVFHAGFVIWHAVTGNPRLLNAVYEHFAAIIALPFAGFAALGLVLLLESRSDQPLEFKALGFEFKGASGPIVLWVICFLAVVISLRLLW